MNYEQWSARMNEFFSLMDENNKIKNIYPKVFGEMLVKINQVQNVIYDAMANFQEENPKSEEANKSLDAKYQELVKNIERTLNNQMEVAVDEYRELMKKLSVKDLENGKRKKFTRRVDLIKAI